MEEISKTNGRNPSQGEVVSVIIPTYNRPTLLRRALESVVNQSYKNLEIIIINDGGDESSRDITQSFKDDRITYLSHGSNKGGSAARNTGIRNTKGEYIAFLDDDDQWIPSKIETQLNKMAKTDPDVGFCFSAVTNVYENREEDTWVPEGIDDYFDLALERFNGFLNVTLFVKKAVLEDVGGFDENLPSHQEVDLVLKMARKYKGLGINRSLVKVDMSDHRQVGRNLLKRAKGREMILKKYLNEFSIKPIVFAKHQFGLGLMYRDMGNFDKAQSIFKEALKNNFNLRYLAHFIILLWGGRLYKLVKK